MVFCELVVEVGDVSLVKSQMSMSSVSSLLLISKISSKGKVFRYVGVLERFQWAREPSKWRYFDLGISK